MAEESIIRWVANKPINIEQTTEKIIQCIKSRHVTNNGINVVSTQKQIKEIFKLDDNKELLLVCNGAMGINALIGGYNMFYNKKLKWAVQAFTFPCSVQGALEDSSIVFDVDENGGPNINKMLERVNEFDGILVTNCFGTSSNIILYENFCKIHNKILLFDNAASSMTYYGGKNHLNYGNGCMVSLHHTKPIGFGEGGFIVFDKHMLPNMEQCICFGFTSVNRHNYSIYASNYKMSEIACIYIADYLKFVPEIYAHHTMLITYFINSFDSDRCKCKLYHNFSEYNNSLMACIPLVFQFPIQPDIFIQNKIEAKKYYYPITQVETSPIATAIFENIICLPLNMNMTTQDIDKYIQVICCML